MAGINAALLRAAELANEAFHVATDGRVGLYIPATGGLRSQRDQDALYAQGRTTPGPIVTWTRASKHVQGRALDLWFMLDGRVIPPEQVPRTYYEMLYAAMRHHLPSVRWGGLWSTPDLPHFEV